MNLSFRSLAAAISFTLTAAMASTAHAQYRRDRPAEIPLRYALVGPYFGGDIGLHDPIGDDYSSNLDGGLSGHLIVGWRFLPELSLEASYYGASGDAPKGSASWGNVGIDARIYPFIYDWRPVRRKVVEPDIIVGWVPAARFSGPGGNDFHGSGFDVGGGLRIWPAGQLMYLTLDARYSFLRFNDENGSHISPAFNGDDFTVNLGIGIQIPMYRY